MTMIAVDTVAVQRMAHVLPRVQEQVPAADDDYVYAGAVCVGLNRLFDPTFRFVAEDFADPGEGEEEIDVAVDEADDARATSLAAELDVPVSRILSAALCTGMAKLVGSTTRLAGPFEVV